MDVLGIVLSLCLLMFMAYMGFSVILFAPVFALLAASLHGFGHKEFRVGRHDRHPLKRRRQESEDRGEKDDRKSHIGHEHQKKQTEYNP